MYVISNSKKETNFWLSFMMDDHIYMNMPNYACFHVLVRIWTILYARVQCMFVKTLKHAYTPKKEKDIDRYQRQIVTCMYQYMHTMYVCSSTHAF